MTRRQKAPLNRKKQLQVYAELVKHHPTDERYIKRYAELLLQVNKTATATELLRRLHMIYLSNGDAAQATLLVKQFPIIGHVPESVRKKNNNIAALLPASMRKGLWLKLHQQRLREGQHLCYRGDHGDTLYLVSSGELAEYIHTDQGTALMLNLISVGEVASVNKLLNPGTYQSELVANKATTVVKLPRKKMLEAMKSNPALQTALQNKSEYRRILSSISSSPILQIMPLDMRKHLASESHIEIYPANSTIYKAGEKLTYVDLVMQGQAAYHLQEKDNTKELKLLRPGSLIGEIRLLHQQGSPAALITHGGVNMLHIPYPIFANVVEAYPPLAKQLTAYAEERRSRLMRKVNELQTQAIR